MTPMTEPQLVAALRLLDDESASVRAEVQASLLALGETLETRLAPHLAGLNPESASTLGQVLRAHRRPRFLATWFRFMEENDEMAALEKALQGLSWLDIGQESSKLPVLLDQLARQFRLEGRPMNPGALIDFLFREGLYRGATGDYYHPAHSNILHVLKEGQGLPISLSMIALLVAHRLGLHLLGLPTPRHFLVSTVWNGQVAVFDCYKGGRLLSPSDMNELTNLLPEGRRSFVRGAKTWEMVARVLRNLSRSAEVRGDEEEQVFFGTLERELAAASR